MVLPAMPTERSARRCQTLARIMNACSVLGRGAWTWTVFEGRPVEGEELILIHHGSQVTPLRTVDIRRRLGLCTDYEHYSRQCHRRHQRKFHGRMLDVEYWHRRFRRSELSSQF